MARTHHLGESASSESMTWCLDCSLNPLGVGPTSFFPPPNDQAWKVDNGFDWDERHVTLLLRLAGGRGFGKCLLEAIREAIRWPLTSSLGWPIRT